MHHRNYQVPRRELHGRSCPLSGIMLMLQILFALFLCANGDGETVSLLQHTLEIQKSTEEKLGYEENKRTDDEWEPNDKMASLEQDDEEKIGYEENKWTDDELEPNDKEASLEQDEVGEHIWRENGTHWTGNPIYLNKGDGHCEDSYLRGHGESRSLADCQARCSAESDCKYVSHNTNRRRLAACSRYSGSCRRRFRHTGMGYTTYQKSSPLGEGSNECYNAGTTKASRDAACAGTMVCARDGYDGRNFGGCWWEHCCTQVFQSMGDGHCRDGYRRGHGESRSLADCQARCAAESDCNYVSHNTNRRRLAACSRYSGTCRRRFPHTGMGYTTYQYRERR